VLLGPFERGIGPLNEPDRIALRIANHSEGDISRIDGFDADGGSEGLGMFNRKLDVIYLDIEYDFRLAIGFMADTASDRSCGSLADESVLHVTFALVVDLPLEQLSIERLEGRSVGTCNFEVDDGISHDDRGIVADDVSGNYLTNTTRLVSMESPMSTKNI